MASFINSLKQGTQDMGLCYTLYKIHRRFEQYSLTRTDLAVTYAATVFGAAAPIVFSLSAADYTHNPELSITAVIASFFAAPCSAALLACYSIDLAFWKKKRRLLKIADVADHQRIKERIKKENLEFLVG
jgi:hypothetical protein